MRKREYTPMQELLLAIQDKGAVCTAVVELERTGYIYRCQAVDETGRSGGNEDISGSTLFLCVWRVRRLPCRRRKTRRRDIRQLGGRRRKSQDKRQKKEEQRTDS